MIRRIVLLSLLLLLVPVAAGNAAPLVRVDADPALSGPRLPSSFLGVSQEYRFVEVFTGNPVLGYNGVNGGFFRTLAGFGSGVPVLRVGGVSTDDTWWNPTGAPKPRGVYGTMSPRMLEGLRTFADTTGARLLLGLNFANPDPGIAVDEARAIVGSIPSRHLLGLEVGNEPDFYERRPLYEEEDGTVVHARDEGYGPGAYGRELEAALRRLRPVVGDVALAGPSMSPTKRWVDALPRLLRRRARGLDLVTMHAYPLEACEKEPGEPGYPTVAQLLAPDSVRRPAVSIVPAVRAGAARGLGTRVTESNSVACGGADGVSNGFAAGLWAMDHLFSMWLIGARGVDFHASSRAYQPFGSGYTREGFRGIARTPFYGMLAFAEATQHRSRLLPSVFFGARPRRGANVHAWGTYDKRRRTVRVVVINKDLRRGGKAVVRVRGARGLGRVVRLRAPSVSDEDQTTWGGQAVPVPTADGRPAGRRVEQRVRRRSGRPFRFSVRRASAAMLTVRVRSRRR